MITPQKSIESNIVTLVVSCFRDVLDGNDVERVNRANEVIFLQENDNVFPNQHEFWMRNFKLATIREMEHERAKAILQSFSDLHRVHGVHLAQNPNAIKRCVWWVR